MRHLTLTRLPIVKLNRNVVSGLQEYWMCMLYTDDHDSYCVTHHWTVPGIRNGLQRDTGFLQKTDFAFCIDRDKRLMLCSQDVRRREKEVLCAAV